jgi:hypothetical protein
MTRHKHHDLRPLLDGRFYDARLRARFAADHPEQFAAAIALAEELYRAGRTSDSR